MHLCVHSSDGTVELIFVDDAVSYEPLSPLQLVEYCYSAPSSSSSDSSSAQECEWIASCIGSECLESYTATKYSLWKSMFLKAFDGCAKVGSDLFSWLLFPITLSSYEQYVGLLT